MILKTKELGQFFTPEYVADFMISLSKISKNSKILEPACGEGVFLKLLEDKGFNNIIGYEIDNTIEPKTNSKIIYKSFVSAKLTQKFDLVIGNPPYIRWKNLNNKLRKELINNKLWNKYFNSLCDYLCIFILKSIQQLKNNGELIFITPEYWINTKHAVVLRNYLVEMGYFVDIIHFNETPIFNKVASSIIIFKFIKTNKPSTSNKINVVKYLSIKKLTNETLIKIKNKIEDKKIEYFEIDQFKTNENWILTPSKKMAELALYESKCTINNPLILFNRKTNYVTLGDIADIGNGLVSGLDNAFQLSENCKLLERECKATISVLKAKNMKPFIYDEITKYIFINGSVKCEKDLKNNYPNFFMKLKPFREKLEQRYNYNRNINYWEWVFLRSYNLFKQNREKIFIPCKERISHKNYFRFCYVHSGIFPTQDVTAIYLKPNTKESIYYVLALLNNENVFEWLKYKGVIKGNIIEFSEKPLASIPLKLINWDDKYEVKLHKNISLYCKNYILKKNDNSLKKLTESVKQLF